MKKGIELTTMDGSTIDIKWDEYNVISKLENDWFTKTYTYNMNEFIYVIYNALNV